MAQATRRGRIGVIGDLHSSWDDHDVHYFNRAGYELLLFAGDLGGAVLRDGLRIARSLSRLSATTLVMPGNNDVEHFPHFDAELTVQRGLVDLMNDPSLSPNSGLRHATGGAKTCGFSRHELDFDGLAITLIAGRPFALGASEVSYRDALHAGFGVSTLEQSISRLEALVDAVTTEHVVFFAHNGPAGLGHTRESLWGCDFRAEAGDWGDRDLTIAIERARARGLKILAVIAGHMHWSLRGGGEREWQVVRDGTLYLNSARVPRIFPASDGVLRHHIALTLTAEGAHAEPVLVASDG